jgi:hypothetical protein
MVQRSNVVVDSQNGKYGTPAREGIPAHSALMLAARITVVQSGDFITTSGIYGMNDHPGREVTPIYGDAVPTFQTGCPQVAKGRQTTVEQVSRF